MPNIWSRINTVLLVCVLLAIAGMMAMRVSGGPLDPPGPPASTDAVKQPGTPISSAPFTISSPGHYYVTKNLAYNGAGAAIIISASNVTLDLGGFTLLGNDSANSGGVWVSGFFFPITIENGIVRDFSIGVDGFNGSMVKVRDVTAYSNGVGIAVGNHAEISDCTVAVSTQQGIRVVGSLSRIQGCMVFDSGEAGIQLEGVGNLVENSRLARNDPSLAGFGADVEIPDASYIDNALRGNTMKGTLKNSAPATLARDNSWCGFQGTAPSISANNLLFCG